VKPAHVGPWAVRNGVRLRVIRLPTVAEQLDDYYRARPGRVRQQSDPREDHEVPGE